MYVRNQRLNAPKEQTTSSNLADMGWVAARTRVDGGELLGWLMSLTGEATPKACGVGVARPQGHSWAPNSSIGSRVNVGTFSPVPSPADLWVVGGNARCRRMLAGRGGGPVVVRAGESPVHGEGVQRVRSRRAKRGGRW